LIADTDFLVRISSHTNVVRITQPLASVRIHRQSISSQLDSLALQLTEDYLFQLRPDAHGAAQTDKEVFSDCEELAWRFLDELFAQSIRSGRRDLLEKALELQRELASLSPTYRMGRARGSHALWKFAEHSAFANLLRAASITVKSIRRLKRPARAPDLN